jgi:hypothetical protein
MDCPGTSCKIKGSLREQEISDLFSEELSEVPSGSDSGKTVNLSQVIQHESDSESSSEESAGTATWGTVDKTPNLGKLTGNPGVKVFPSDTKEVSDVADMFFEDSFFDLLCLETNRYYLQNREKYDRRYKVLKWADVTSAEMKIFLAIIILMGQIKKESLKDYWSTDPYFETKIFRKLMSCKRFEQIWSCLHFNDNEQQPQSGNRLFKIQPLIRLFP